MNRSEINEPVKIPYDIGKQQIEYRFIAGLQEWQNGTIEVPWTTESVTLRVDLGQQTLKKEDFYDLLAHWMAIGPVGRSTTDLVGVSDVSLDSLQGPKNTLEHRLLVQRGDQYYLQYNYLNRNGYLSVSPDALSASGDSIVREVGRVDHLLTYESDQLVFEQLTNPIADSDEGHMWSLESLSLVSVAPIPTVSTVTGGICSILDNRQLSVSPTDWIGLGGATIDSDRLHLSIASNDAVFHAWIDRSQNFALTGEFRVSTNITYNQFGAIARVMQWYVVLVPQGLGQTDHVYGIPIDNIQAGGSIFLESDWFKPACTNKILSLLGVPSDYAPLDLNRLGDSVYLGIGCLQRRFNSFTDQTDLAAIPIVYVNQRHCLNANQNFLTYRYGYTPERFYWFKGGTRVQNLDQGFGVTLDKTGLDISVVERHYNGTTFTVSRIDQIDRTSIVATNVNNTAIFGIQTTEVTITSSLIYAEVLLKEEWNAPVYGGIAYGDTWFITELAPNSASTAFSGLLDLFGIYNESRAPSRLTSKAGDLALFATSDDPIAQPNISFVLVFRIEPAVSNATAHIDQIRWLPGYLTA